MAVRVAHDEVTQLQAPRPRGQGTGHRPPLVTRAAVVQGHEMIEHPAAVQRRRLVGQLPGGEEGRPVHVLLARLEADPHAPSVTASPG